METAFRPGFGRDAVITLRSNFWIAAGLALSLVLAEAPAAHAGPALAYWSDEADYDQDSCVQRAQASFAADGWQGIKPNGHAVMADRGPLSGVMVCLDESLTQSVPVVVVTGGGDNAASDEADRLQHQMLGR
jgi:hypothetical protein